MHTEATTLHLLAHALDLVDVAKTHQLDGEDEHRLRGMRSYLASRREEIERPNQFRVAPGTVAHASVARFVDKLNRSVVRLHGGVSLVVHAVANNAILRGGDEDALFDYVINTAWCDGRIVYNFVYTVSGHSVVHFRDDLNWARHIVHAVFNELFIRSLTSDGSPG